MTSHFRHLAPAGAPITAADLAAAASRLALSEDPRDELRKLICRRFAVPHAVVTSTGRAGMTLLLRAMRHLAPAHKTEVVLPSYTCYSLAASTVKAGLRPRLVDISPRTLDFDRSALDRTDFSRVLAIVATNLFGLPNDLPALTARAKAENVFLIDDAAQSMGATIAGRASGTWGDAGLFSFDKGKPVSAIDGGVVVARSRDLGATIEREAATLAEPHLTDSTLHLVKMAAYVALLPPRRYWIPQRIPFLGLGRTEFTTDYPVERLGRLLAAVALSALDHLEEYSSIRATRAAEILAGLDGVDGVERVEPHQSARATYLRVPVLVDTDARTAAVDTLNRSGVGASCSYPASLADVPELRAHLVDADAPVPGGRSVASRIITLPAHPFVTSADASAMASTLAGALAHVSRSGARQRRKANPICVA